MTVFLELLISNTYFGFHYSCKSFNDCFKQSRGKDLLQCSQSNFRIGWKLDEVYEMADTGLHITCNKRFKHHANMQQMLGTKAQDKIWDFTNLPSFFDWPIQTDSPKTDRELQDHWDLSLSKNQNNTKKQEKHHSLWSSVLK